MPKIQNGGKIKVPSKDLYVKPENYDDLVFVMIDDYTYRLLWRKDAVLEAKRMIGKPTYDGEYLTIPEEILECYDTDIVFVYVEYMSLHIKFKNLKRQEEKEEPLSEEWIKRLEDSFIVLEKLKKSDETVEDFLNSIPIGIKKAIFRLQKPRLVENAEEEKKAQN